MTDLIGQRLGQYEITASLGEGGMATVYRARQLNIQRDVAIKVIESKLARSSEFTKRFEREAQTIAVLNHPHILKLFDFGQQGDLLYLVMELQPGGSLADLIRRGSVPLKQISRLLGQIASALDYAHTQGIVHRDLKPQNVLLDENNNAILADFGIAKILGDSDQTRITNTGLAIGTPAYMPPEQWTGKSIDGRSDLYALGVIVYEMLAGHLPFNGDTPAQMMYAHLYEPPAPLSALYPGLPPGIEPVIQKALAKEPDKRFQSTEAFAEAFAEALSRAVLEDQPLRDQLTASGYLGTPRRKVNASGWLVALAVGVLLILGLGGLIIRGIQNGSPMPTLMPSLAVAAANETATKTTLPTLPVTVPPTAMKVAPYSPTPRPSETTTHTLTSTFSPIPATEMAEITPAASRIRPSPMDTFTPTNTLTPVNTFTPTSTFAPTNTDDPTCRALPVVQGTPLEFRSGPGTYYDLLWRTGVSAPMRVTGLNEDPRWIEVELLGKTGWVLAERVTVQGICSAIPFVAAPPSPTAKASPATQAANTASECLGSVNTKGLNMRSGPGTDAAVIITLPLGETVNILEGSPDGIWLKITARGSTGWVAAAYISLFKVCGTEAAASPAPTMPPPTVLSPASGTPPTQVAHNSDWRPQVQKFGGVVMVLMPPGCFTMGSSNDQIESALQQCQKDNAAYCPREQFSVAAPPQQVCFDKPLWIDKYEVTNEQFSLFGGHRTQTLGQNWPLEGIAWFEARDFCTRRGARLPTEAEWEYAARGPDSLIYPWGNTAAGNEAVINKDSGGLSAEVGSKLKDTSWVGASDLAGNVWEWTSSIYQPYPYRADDGRENGADTTNARVLRGGSWLNFSLSFFRAAYRNKYSPSDVYAGMGFRCVRDY